MVGFDDGFTIATTDLGEPDDFKDCLKAIHYETLPNDTKSEIFWNPCEQQCRVKKLERASGRKTEQGQWTKMRSL